MRLRWKLLIGITLVFAFNSQLCWAYAFWLMAHGYYLKEPIQWIVRLEFIIAIIFIALTLVSLIKVIQLVISNKKEV